MLCGSHFLLSEGTKVARSCFCTHCYPCQGSEQMELVPFGAIGPFLGVSLCTRSSQKEKPGSGPPPSIRPREGIEISLADPNRSTTEGTRGKGWGSASRAPRVSPLPDAVWGRESAGDEPQLKITKAQNPSSATSPFHPGRFRGEAEAKREQKSRRGAARGRSGSAPGPAAGSGRDFGGGARVLAPPLARQSRQEPGAALGQSREPPLQPPGHILAPLGSETPGGSSRAAGPEGGIGQPLVRARRAARKALSPFYGAKGSPGRAGRGHRHLLSLCRGRKTSREESLMPSRAGMDAAGERSPVGPAPLPRSVASHAHVCAGSTPLLLPARCFVRSQALTSRTGRHTQAPTQLVFLRNATEKLCWECTRG